MPLIELLIRALYDPLPEVPVDGAYLFGQTVDNEQSVFATAVDLVSQHQTRQLLIPDSVPRCGYPGFRAWQQALIGLGLRDTTITGISTASYPTLNTLIEATAVVGYAKQKSISSIFVVSPPFHQLRAFMTTVSVALQEFPELQIYNRVGIALPWHETVFHSQGTLECTRSDLIHSELERIERYQAKGDLAAAEAVLEYINRRDSLD
jgi:hypothetical protein